MTEQDNRGFSLIEVLLSAAILAIVLVGVTPMYVVGLKANASAGDLSNCVALAQERMEKLRNLPWDDLPQGGDVDAPADGFSEAIDVDGNQTADFQLAWSIDNASTLSSTLSASKIHVRAVAVACSTTRGERSRSGKARKVLLNTYVTKGLS